MKTNPKGELPFERRMLSLGIGRIRHKLRTGDDDRVSERYRSSRNQFASPINTLRDLAETGFSGRERQIADSYLETKKVSCRTPLVRTARV